MSTSASADARKGKQPGQSCAECRRYLLTYLPPKYLTRSFFRLGTLRSKLKCDRLVPLYYCTLGYSFKL